MNASMNDDVVAELTNAGGRHGRAGTTSLVDEDGFGFDFDDANGDVVHLLARDSDERFDDYLRVLVSRLLDWFKELPELVQDDRVDDLSRRAFSAFTYGVAAVAQEHGVPGYTRADLYVEMLDRWLIGFDLVCERLPNADHRTIRTEMAELARHGLLDQSEVERERVLREALAASAQRHGRLGEEIATRLRRAPVIRCSRRLRASQLPLRVRRRRSARRRTRARVSRTRSSRGDPGRRAKESADGDDAPAEKTRALAAGTGPARRSGANRVAPSVESCIDSVGVYGG